MKNESKVTEPKVIVALDYDDVFQAEGFVEKVSPDQCKLKVGKELFTLAGPDFVKTLVDKGFDVFLDLKFHDIPNTVAKAVARAADLGVWMTDVHASGGRVMMEAAKKQLSSTNSDMLLIAVTVLTSMDKADLTEIGIDLDPRQQVIRLAKLAQQAGMDGVVSSAQEVPLLREACGSDFHLVTPGIRLQASANGDDQKRVVTPQDAINNGCSYLVIGRPITQSADPLAVLLGINSQIG